MKHSLSLLHQNASTDQSVNYPTLGIVAYFIFEYFALDNIYHLVTGDDTSMKYYSSSRYVYILTCFMLIFVPFECQNIYPVTPILLTVLIGFDRISVLTLCTCPQFSTKYFTTSRCPASAA